MGEEVVGDIDANKSMMAVMWGFRRQRFVGNMYLT